MSTILVLTGDMRSGKTELCVRIHAIIRSEGISTCGIVERNERDIHGIPIALHLVHMETGEQRLLSARKSLLDPDRDRACDQNHNQNRPAGNPNHSSYPPFVFDATAFSWANSILEISLSKGTTCFFIDEIGPEELNYGKGFLPFLEHVTSCPDIVLVLSVRPSLAENLAALLRSKSDHKTELLSLSIEPKEIDRQAKDAAKMLLSRCQSRFYSI